MERKRTNKKGYETKEREREREREREGGEEEESQSMHEYSVQLDTTR
jgi:hypothetical protein